MKHIRLYEYYSELPKDFSVEDIENMTEDEFFKNLEILNSKDKEQAFSLVEIWLNANPNAQSDMDFNRKIGAYGDVFVDKLLQKDKYVEQVRATSIPAQITKLESEIKADEESLMMKREKLANLKSRNYSSF